MNIVCVIDNLGSGGAQRQLVTLAKAFAQAGHAVTMLTYHPSDFFAGDLQAHRIPLICLNEPRPLPRILKLRRFLRSGDQDVVLSFLDTPNLLVELAALPARRWGLVVSERSANRAGILSRKGRLLRGMHRVADAVVTNSSATQQILADAFPALATRLQTIYNTVDFARFTPSSTYEPRATGRTRIVVAASYQRLKNMHGVITAIAQLSPDERARLTLDWYGRTMVTDGNDLVYREVQELVDTLGVGDAVHLYGDIKSIEEQMQQADAIGLFSFYEGLPNTICEGMACGKPIIMSDVSDARHLVDPARNGLLCDPKDSSSIADALRRLIVMPDEALREMGAQSYIMAQELFEHDRIVGRFLGLLQDAAARYRPQVKVPVSSERP
jgi:glycosyltransferase involved in cell wall biosynthesis